MRILLTRFYLLFLAVLILVSRSHWQPGAWATTLLFFTALSMVSASVAGRMWCSLYIAGHKNTRLVMEGPYSLCRNPLYFCSLLGALGIALTTETFTLPLLVVIAFAVYYPAIILREEKELQKRHGRAMEHYVASVPAFIPCPAHFHQPESYEVKPRIFFTHLTSAIWFILALGVIQLLKTVRMAGHLPAWLTLY
jgi:protein-S-isoprenylcysteine O-methyltransferase Ste14